MTHPLLGLLVLCLPACHRPGVVVLDAEERPPMSNGPRIQGRDGGLSATVWGRSAWSFGDTVLDVPDEYGQSWHHNSFGWSSDRDPTDGLDPLDAPLDAAGAPLHFLPPSEEEQRFNLAHSGDDCEAPCGARWAVWPGVPVWIEAQERAVVFYGLIYAEPGDFNFRGVGSSLASWADPDALPVRPVVDADAEHPDLLWGPEVPGLGLGPTVIGEHLYTFACDGPGDGFPCLLARADLAHLWEPEAWQWRTRSGWSADLDEARPLFEGAPIMSVQRHEGLDLWLAVYSRPFDDAVVVRSAPELLGPWSGEEMLFRAATDPYDAVRHAELDEDDTITVTYSRSTGEGWFGSEFAVWTVRLARHD